MLKDRNIQRLVRDEMLKAKSTLTADDLFTSHEYARHIQSLVDTTTGKYDIPVVVELHHEDPKMASFTDGAKICQNTRSDMAYCFNSLENKYMANVGITFHECAHILFLNFDEEKKCFDFVGNGLFYGTEPAAKTAEEAANLIALKDAMAQEELRPIFQNIYSDLLNRFDDPHDEDALIDRFGGFVQRAIQVLRESLWMRTPSIESIMDEVKRGKRSKLEAMYSAILMFARFGQLVSSDPEHVMQTEIGVKLSQTAQDIMLARYTHNTVERVSHVNNIVLALWPWIVEELKNQENRSQGSQGDPQSKPSQEAIQQVLEQLQRSAKNSGGTTAPQNRKSSKEAQMLPQGVEQKQTIPNGSQSQKLPGNVNSNDPIGKGMVEKLISSIATKKAEQAVQEQISLQTNCEIMAVDQNSTHRGIPVEVFAQTKIDQEAKDKYNQEMSSLMSISKRLQRRMRDALRDLQDGDVAYHKVFGSSFEVRDAYRPDERFFSKKNLPQDLPDMAISLLVDHSGSMCGDRIHAAMRAAMLLYDFATNLGIPMSVLGHATSGSTVEIYTYTEFSQVTASEKYRLAKMVTGGCNRDGLAIEVAANLLAKRHEEIKLLLILSDGQPNHNEYGGSGAQKDIQGIVKKYRKHNIEVIATAIGTDKGRIKSIYGEGSFLDIEDLDRLPITLTKIVQKRILRN